MRNEIIRLQEPGSTEEAWLQTYFWQPSGEMVIKKRPVIIVCPGGGYCYVSEREGEPLALQWNAMGYHAVVLHYSVAPKAQYPTALLELARTVVLLREHAEEWGIDEDRILVMGSSAGGHLAASYACFWSESFLSEQLGCKSEQLRPNGLLLNYPVITSGAFAHRDSFRNLLGERYEELKERMSLERQVNEENPPTFLWHTLEDGVVPVENSLLFLQALHQKGISAELHIYPKGGHGLALADENTATAYWSEIIPGCQSWVTLARTWLRETFGAIYRETKKNGEGKEE